MKLSRLFCCLFSVMGFAAAYALDKPEIFRPMDGAEVMIINSISPNGQYAISETPGDRNSDDPQPAGGAIIDLQTKQITHIPAVQGRASVNKVIDNGLVVGSAAGKPASWSLASGEWTLYDLPAGATYGKLMSVSADGRLAVGYAQSGGAVQPICIDLQTKTYRALPGIPTLDRAGENKHENLFYEISPDGRLVLGQMSPSHIFPPELFSYIYDLEQNTWTPIGLDYDAATKQFTNKCPGFFFTSNQWLSADGAWVTGTAYMVVNGSELQGGREFWAPYRYNIAEDAFEVFDDAPDMAGNRVAPDGTMLTCSPYGDPYPTAYVRAGKYYVSLNKILSQVYGMNLQTYAGDNVSGAFQALSADGKTAAMITQDNCYILRMPESFLDAAKKVDLLADFTSSLPSGSNISRIGEISLTFEHEVSCKNLPSTVKLLDAKGGTAATAVLTAVDNANPRKFVVTFRTTALNAGEKYTVKIPAQYISLKDEPSYKSKEIVLQYTGRSEGAVKALKITPVSGSAVAQFNSTTDPLAVTFDADVAIADNAQCLLYSAEEADPIAAFIGSAQGRTAYFYPTDGVLLYEGSDYRITITAGSVTDLSGAGGCEEITLNYKGAYRREVNDNERYIFHSDCEDYSNFIFWQSRSPEPGAVAKSWGFVQGMPWGLVADEGDYSNQALAAHSMFATPDESDDWLVTPQLYIPDDNINLTFKAQSYLKSKTDRLRVYVLRADRVINYMSEALADEFRNSGDLILDVVLSPGASEERLAGDWTNYAASLKPYAGKNIYIAFVNNNVDQSAVILDNISVERNLDFIMECATPQSVVRKEDIKISGSLTINNPIETYTALMLTLTDGSGNEVSRIEASGLSLGKGDVYEFEFPKPLKLTIGEINKYALDVITPQTSATFRYTIKDFSEQFRKAVVLEEYTGSECGNCPLGIRAIETLQEIYGWDFMPVTLRTYKDDFYGTGLGGYSQYLQCDRVGAPSARINRGEILTPTCSTSEGIKFFGKGIFNSQGKEEYLWGDAVADAFAEIPEADIHADVNYVSSTGEITIESVIRLALNTQPALRVFAVVIENQLPTYQLNGYYSATDPALGEWANNGKYAQDIVTSYLFNDVARFVVNGTQYNGSPVDTSGSRGFYEHTLTATMPTDLISNYINSWVVVMLIDGADGRVINATRTELMLGGVENVTSDSREATISASGSVIAACASGEVTLEVYSPAGMLLGRACGSENVAVELRGYTGVAIARATAPGGVTTRKFAIK